MITVDNDNAWNEYVKTHEEARQFRYKAIPNWYDLVDLCAKDRATVSRAETAQDADNVMSREIFEENINEGTNEIIDVDWTSTDQGLERANHALKRGQSATSSTQSQKRRDGEKDGLIASIREVATSLKEFMQATTKKVVDVNEVLDELKCIPDLDSQQWLKAVN